MSMRVVCTQPIARFQDTTLPHQGRVMLEGEMNYSEDLFKGCIQDRQYIRD